jgi:hypothetical protein
MTPQQIGALSAFVVAIADHFDAPGPSPDKTAEHYQLARRARVLRSMIANDIGADGVGGEFVPAPNARLLQSLPVGDDGRFCIAADLVTPLG